MLINVFDKNLNRLGVAEEITCLIWQRRYWQCGSFALQLPVSEKHAALMQKGNLIMPHGYDEAAVIQYVHIRKDSEGLEQIEVQGKFLPRWIGKRVLINQIVETEASPEAIVFRIADENAINPADEKRKIAQLSGTDAGQTGILMEYTSEINANALSEIEYVCKAAEVGFRVRTDARSKTNTLVVYAGRDLTAGNAAGNKPCIFAQEYDNIIEQTYTIDDEDARNMAYVGGEDDGKNPRVVVQVGADRAGLERDEIFVEAVDIGKSYTSEDGAEITLSDAEYRDMLIQRGKSDLAQQAEVLEFDSRVSPASNLVYRKDYDVGDVVTCRNKRWGVQTNVRITEVIETYQTGETEIEVIFGQPMPTVSDKIKRIERR